jgi:hypothetical protein
MKMNTKYLRILPIPSISSLSITSIPNFVRATENFSKIQIKGYATPTVNVIQNPILKVYEKETMRALHNSTMEDANKLPIKPRIRPSTKKSMFSALVFLACLLVDNPKKNPSFSSVVMQI